MGFLQIRTVTVRVRLFVVQEGREGRGMTEMWGRQEV